MSDRRLRPGPPAKLAAASPMRCFASWMPENPRASPKSTVRFELNMEKTKMFSVCEWNASRLDGDGTYFQIKWILLTFSLLACV